MRIEEMIRKNANEWGVVDSEYIIRVQQDKGSEGLKVYVRPSDRSGDTINYIVKDNILFPTNE
jgi:hypothetical protein